MPPTIPVEYAPLFASLAAIRRKVKALGLLYGLGAVLAVAAGVLLLVVALDYTLNMHAVPRAVFMMLGLAGIAWAVWSLIIRPLASRMPITDIAGRLENVFPEFDDRLRSTVDFVRDDIPGSAVMKQRTIADAARLAGAVDMDDIIVRKPVIYALGVGIGALALILILAMAFPKYRGIAASRLMLGDQPWPKRVQIDLLRELPAKVAVGQRVDLKMRLAKGDKSDMKAIVYYRYDSGPVHQQLMQRNADGTYAVGIDAKGAGMTVWMKAGDDQTRPALIQVVQRLAITRVEAKITPPTYAKLPPTSVDLSEAPAQVTVGSHVLLTISFNKPLATKPVAIESVKSDEPSPAIQWGRPGDSIATAGYTAMQPLRFRIRATDIDDFDNAGLEEYEISVRPDQNPSVVIENPRSNQDNTPVAVVHLQALAEDDFDIKSMTLVIDRLGDKKHWEIPLEAWSPVESSVQRKRFRIHHEWELARIPDANLKPGDVLEYHIRVTDNYELNGKYHEPAISGRLKINIVSQETLSNQITDAMRAVAERVKQAQNAQNRIKTETQNLRKDTEGKQQMDPADRAALNRLADQQSAVTSQTRQLSGTMNDVEQRLNDNRSDNQELKDIARDVKTALGDAADKPMGEATRRLSEANQNADPRNARTDEERQQQAGHRNENIKQAETSQQQASEKLGQALEKMGSLGMFDRLIEQVRSLLNDQQNLSKQTSNAGNQTIGKDPGKLTPEEKKALDDIARRQKELADKTDKLTADLNKAGTQTQKSDPATAEAMKRAAQQSQQQQVSSNMQQASQAAQQNQQAQAQARQKQAELGLQIMLDTLREAERRKLEQLAKDLAKLEELVGNLIRRQAGHNIDNLRLRGGEDLLKLVTDELLLQAERIRDKQPAIPGNEVLTRSQIQTETNSRDVAKTAENVQRGGVEVAAILSKAAGHMERAIVVLKATQLAEAYDPNQVRALATLEDAMKKVDELAKDVNDQLDQANRETVRQLYEKIRAEQEKINTETTRIDKAERLSDGTLSRRDAVSLNRLPGEQGALADQTKKLEESLSALGGVVYVWANQDIVKSMGEVRDMLGKPDTGIVTRTEEQRIVDQLDAMIKSLAVKPRQTDFHGDGGGGGGGSGAPKPRLPTEAELRLLKELQLAVNKATKVLNQQPNPDQPKLVGLGGRQGELRNLLDTLLQKASRGQVKLDPEPDPKDKLPEEASVDQIENDELEDWLLGSKSGDDQLTDDVKAAGQRMARSRQRLALDHDPGKTTQAIQDRIVLSLDNLIKLAQAQQAQSRPQQGRQPGQRPGQDPNQGQNMGQQNTGISQSNQGNQPAGSEAMRGTQDNTVSGQDIREKAGEWGGLTPREIKAIIEGAQDKSIPKYEKLIRDYYEMMSRKATEQR